MRSRRGARRTGWALLAAALLAACSDDTSVVETGSSTTTVATTTAPAVTTTTPAPSTTSAPSTTVVGAAWSGDVVVVAADGLWAVPASGAPTRLLPAPVSRAAVGPDGTVYFQRRAFRDEDPAGLDAAVTRIEALDRRTGAVRTVLAPASATPAAGALTLEGVIVVAGRPELLVRRFRFDPTKLVEEQASEILVRRDLATGTERELRVTGAWEFGMALVSYGGGVFVGVGRSEGSMGVMVFGPDGADAGGRVADRFAKAWCTFASAGCAYTATVAPSGRSVAWIEADDPVPSSEVRWRLVVADVDTGRRREVVLDAMAADVEIVLADDDHVLVGRVPYPAGAAAPAVEARASIVDVTTGAVRALPVGGAVRPDAHR